MGEGEVVGVGVELEVGGRVKGGVGQGVGGRGELEEMVEVGVRGGELVEEGRGGRVRLEEGRGGGSGGNSSWGGGVSYGELGGGGGSGSRRSSLSSGGGREEWWGVRA